MYIILEAFLPGEWAAAIYLGEAGDAWGNMRLAFIGISITVYDSSEFYNSNWFLKLAGTDMYKEGPPLCYYKLDDKNENE